MLVNWLKLVKAYVDYNIQNYPHMQSVDVKTLLEDMEKSLEKKFSNKMKPQQKP